MLKLIKVFSFTLYPITIIVLLCSHFVKLEVNAFHPILIGKHFIHSFDRKASLRAEIISPNSSSDLAEFKEWCTEKGIITPLSLEIREDSDKEIPSENSKYRFMEYSDDESFTNRPETLVDVPILRAPLTVCIIAETTEALVIELAKERDLGDKSIYAPYIKVLPSLESFSLQSMPRFWSQEKIDKICEFDGGQIQQQVQIDALKAKELNLDPWAYACVTSRANYLLDKGYAMTPVLDMINHDSSSKTSATIINDDLFLSVHNEFTKGEEVFISYGDYTNFETLCNYGFVSETNANNKESFDVKMIRKLPVRVTVDATSDAMLDAGSLATLRSYLTPPEVVDDILASDENILRSTIFTKPISDSYEEEVYSFIASFLDEAIYQGKDGIDWARENSDTLMEKYFDTRVIVLKKGLQFIRNKFPDLLY